MGQEAICIRPFGNERTAPKEVPIAIAEDFKEATRIAGLSLKGSATLARRCLQGALRDAFAEMPRADLFDEIKWIEEKTDIPDEIKQALHALQKTGNFGAHPQNDVSPVFELGPNELEGCFVVLDTLFELLYVIPKHKRDKITALVERVFPKNTEPKTE